ncbi:hypothetical protein TCAL_16459 [Tigriopus californicus]|uniref:Uncharacterized protein n=1 Tax=Tigriopus californicus TaxID=6832 RepID=A0A553P0H7_TIGCA|nr:hypothetical protein TCAL_16459 [Tigriopus californicus]
MLFGSLSVDFLSLLGKKAGQRGGRGEEDDDFFEHVERLSERASERVSERSHQRLVPPKSDEPVKRRLLFRHRVCRSRCHQQRPSAKTIPSVVEAARHHGPVVSEASIPSVASDRVTRQPPPKGQQGRSTVASPNSFGRDKGQLSNGLLVPSLRTSGLSGPRGPRGPTNIAPPIKLEPSIRFTSAIPLRLLLVFRGAFSLSTWLVGMVGWNKADV